MAAVGFRVFVVRAGQDGMKRCAQQTWKCSRQVWGVACGYDLKPGWWPLWACVCVDTVIANQGRVGQDGKMRCAQRTSCSLCVGAVGWGCWGALGCWALWGL
jgi:hypothetical protein